MPRTATVGPEVHARVTELVKSGKSRTEAFAEVAKERNSSPGTVSANFYRVARQQAPGTRGKPRSAPRATRTTRTTRASSTRSDGDLASLARQIGDLTLELVRRVEERDRRIRELIG